MYLSFLQATKLIPFVKDHLLHLFRVFKLPEERVDFLMSLQYSDLSDFIERHCFFSRYLQLFTSCKSSNDSCKCCKSYSSRLLHPKLFDVESKVIFPFPIIDPDPLREGHYLDTLVASDSFSKNPYDSLKSCSFVIYTESFKI
jgi:hypothetical protein